MARKARQRRDASSEIEPEDESQEVIGEESETPEPIQRTGMPPAPGRKPAPEIKRGDKKALVSEIWRSMPEATASRVAAEYQRRTGATVSLPTVNGAKPEDLKKRQSGARAQAQGEVRSEEHRATIATESPRRVSEQELTLEDLRRVKDLASHFGGVHRLKEAVDALSELTSD